MDRYAAREIVLKSSDLSKGARMLYMALDNFQREGGRCWPRQKALREIVGCSPRSLCRYLIELTEAGLVIAKKTTYGGPNEYRLQWCHQWQNNDANHGTSILPPVASHKSNQEENTEIHKALRAETQKTTCDSCGGTGWKMVVKVARGVGYQCSSTCDCRERKTA